MSDSALPDLEDFRSSARTWLEQHAEPLSEASHTNDDGTAVWGQGSDNVAVFHNLTEQQEAERLEATRVWQQ